MLVGSSKKKQKSCLHILGSNAISANLQLLLMFPLYVRSAYKCYWYHITQYYLQHGQGNWQPNWFPTFLVMRLARHIEGLKTRSFQREDEPSFRVTVHLAQWGWVGSIAVYADRCSDDIALLRKRISRHKSKAKAETPLMESMTTWWLKESNFIFLFPSGWHIMMHNDMHIKQREINQHEGTLKRKIKHHS